MKTAIHGQKMETYQIYVKFAFLGKYWNKRKKKMIKGWKFSINVVPALCTSKTFKDDEYVL